MVHGRGCNPHRSLWRHWWRRNSETITDREKRRPRCPMKSSELSNGENHITLWQLLQNRKWRHLWRHNLGSRRKLQKMAQENFSIGAFYNITKNQDNPIKTVGRDSFLSPKTPKNTSFLGVTQPQEFQESSVSAVPSITRTVKFFDNVEWCTPTPNLLQCNFSYGAVLYCCCCCWCAICLQ